MYAPHLAVPVPFSAHVHQPPLAHGSFGQSDFFEGASEDYQSTRGGPRKMAFSYVSILVLAALALLAVGLFCAGIVVLATTLRRKK